jgi:hypothetical protein
MGFFDRISGGGQIPTHEKVTNVQITPIGVEKVEKSLANGLEFDVLVSVKKCQPCSVDEVARDLNRPEHKIRYVLRCLKSKGWIQTL